VKVELKPLDISTYCKSIFEKFSKTLIMSATILNHKAFCRSVGLSSDQIKFIQVQSDFPVEHRPIIPLNIAYLNYNNLQSAQVQASLLMLGFFCKSTSAFQKRLLQDKSRAAPSYALNMGK